MRRGVGSLMIGFSLAFLFGLAAYMIAVGLTVYDGAISAVIQPICGSVFTLAGLVVVLLVGSPLLVSSVWNWWKRAWWLSLLIVVIGIGALLASWHPCFRVKVIDPETQQPVDAFQPTLAVGGWLLAMFGIAFSPIIDGLLSMYLFPKKPTAENHRSSGDSQCVTKVQRTSG